MTTLTLFLLALGNIIEESDQSVNINKKKIKHYYLVNSEEDGELFSNPDSLMNIRKGYLKTITFSLMQLRKVGLISISCFKGFQN